MTESESRKKILAYREAATKKQEQLWQELALRQQKGWQVAYQAAQLLKKHFAVDKVVLFGSLLDVQRMHSHSDLDLAAWGLEDVTTIKSAIAFVLQTLSLFNSHSLVKYFNGYSTRRNITNY